MVVGKCGDHQMRVLYLTFCKIVIDDENRLIQTVFNDHTSYGSYPHDTKEYWELAQRLGYKSIWDYCVEHEIAHAFVAQEVYGSPSKVLWALAHGDIATKNEILFEEELVISLQGFVRNNLLPGSSAPGFSWHKMKEKFLEVLRS